MGQCKSKVAVLDGSDHRNNINASGVVLKSKKAKRKWRKSKGYSLSASLEGELNCDADTHSLSKGAPKNGPVLVAYNVKNDENKKFNPGRRNSYHPASPPNEFAIEEEVNSSTTVTRMYNEEPIQLRHAQPPIAEPESDLSNFSSPVKFADTSNPFSMTADPYITQVYCTTPKPNQIKTTAEIVIVPEPTICLKGIELSALEEVIPVSQNSFLHFSSIESNLHDSSVSLSTTSLSPHQFETIADGPVLASSSLTLPDRIPNDSPPLLEVKDVSPVVFHPLVSANGSNSCATLDPEQCVGTVQTATDLHPDRTHSQGAASVPLKKSSVVVSNNQQKVSVPVPSNISAILQTGLAPTSFIDELSSCKSLKMGNKNSIKSSDFETEEEYHTGEEEFDAVILVEPPDKFCEQVPAIEVKPMEETPSNSHDMVSSGCDQSTTLLLESMKLEDEVMDHNSYEKVFPNDPIIDKALTSSSRNSDQIKDKIEREIDTLSSQNNMLINENTSEHIKVMQWASITERSEINSKSMNVQRIVENSCAITPIEHIPDVPETSHSTSDFVLSVDGKVMNGSDIQIVTTTSHSGESLVPLKNFVVSQELKKLQNISDKNQDLALKVKSTISVSGIPSETRKQITSLHDINTEEIDGNCNADKEKSLHQQKNSNARYTTIHELRKMFTDPEESSVNSAIIKHDYAPSNDSTSKKTLNKQSVGGNSTHQISNNADEKAMKAICSESPKSCDDLSKLHNIAAQDLTKNWDALQQTKYSEATPNKEIHLSPNIKLEVETRDKANVNQSILKGSNVKSKTLNFDEHHVKFCDNSEINNKIKVHDSTKEDAIDQNDRWQCNKNDRSETTPEESLPPDNYDTTACLNHEFPRYEISQLVNVNPASCHVIMQGDMNEGKSFDLAGTDKNIGCKKVPEKSTRFAQANEMQQEHNIMNHPGDDAISSHNKNNLDMQTEDESCIKADTAAERIQMIREGGNNLPLPGRREKIRQDMCTLQYCIENKDKKLALEVKQSLKRDSSRKLMLEPEIKQEGDNDDHSCLDTLSSQTKLEISESLDEAHQIEHRLSAPGAEKSADSEPDHDTSGDMSQSSASASTDAEVGNNAYFSKFDLNSNSPQLSSLPEMFVDDDNATLSDISPISDFAAALPQLPTDISTPNSYGQNAAYTEIDNSMQKSDDIRTNTNIQKFVSFSMNNENNFNNLTHDGNQNESIYNRDDKYPRASNCPDPTRDTPAHLQVGESNSVIGTDNDPHYGDDEESSSERTRMNTSAESSDISKIESSIELSLRNVAI